MFLWYYNYLILEGRCVDYWNRCFCGFEDSYNDGGFMGVGFFLGFCFY